MNRLITRFIFWTVGIAFAIYIAIIAYLLSSQNSMLFFPDYEGRELVYSPADVGLAYSDVEFSTEDGTRIHAWFVPHDNSRATLIYCHGNAGNIGRRLGALQRWHDLGVSVLIFDYPGFGQSEGSPTEQGTYASARAAWEYLTEDKQIPAHNIVLYGRSLGGGVVAQLASEVDAKGLIIESSFTSVPDMADDIYWWIPVQQLMTVRYETKNKIDSVDYPILIVHSPDDEVVPLSHGQELFEIANEPKQFLHTKGGHNGGPTLSEPEYSLGLDRFLTALDSGPRSGASESHADPH